jgi:uncharacterized protein (TIGR03435 family)
MKHVAALLFVAALAYIAPPAPPLLAPGDGPPAFDVASIKPDATASLTRGFSMPADRLEATNLPLTRLVAFAYGEGGPPNQPLLSDQIVGGQGWMNDEAFDIAAKAGPDVPVGAAGTARKLQMLQTLLAERFKLAVHHETRTGSIYALTQTRADGKLGPKLTRTDVDCEAEAAARGGAIPPPPVPGAIPRCNGQIGIGPVSILRAGGQTMPLLAKLFSRLTNRIVVDRTNLPGAFDVDMRFTADGLPQIGPPGLPNPTPPADSDTPSFFTAVQEQLGLKLDAQRGPMEVVVIDHAERPTSD